MKERILGSERSHGHTIFEVKTSKGRRWHIATPERLHVFRTREEAIGWAWQHEPRPGLLGQWWAWLNGK